MFNQVLEKESPGKTRAEASGSEKRRTGEMKSRMMHRNELCSLQHTLSQGWAGTQDSWSFLCFSGNISETHNKNLCLILLGYRFMPQSLLYNTQSHISVHHNQSLPLCTGKLYTKMPIDLKSITDFKRTAQKQGNHCTPFPTWTDCDRTFNCFTESDIFLLQAQVIQTVIWWQ